MPLDPHSPEFARLATRWLDGSATAAEAALLWEQVLASKACAREFAEQARFELLLQDTLRARADEAGIAAVARKKTVQHHRRLVRRRVFAMAAVLALTGFIAWLAKPGPPTVARLHHEVVKPSPAVMPVTKAKRTTVLVAHTPGSADKTLPPEPLGKRLDKFFLASVALDKVPLHQALKQLEEQLRSLNFANVADLAALRLTLPAEAAAREVTFHSGAIAFLKAVRALAGMAGCDVQVTDASVALVIRPEAGPRGGGVESRSLEQLLAGFGNVSDPLRDRMAEMLHDARVLGIEVSLAGDGSGKVTGLKATRGQFEALTLMAQSRDQIRALPPLRFYVRTSPVVPGAKDRILSEQETVEERKRMQATNAPPPPIITVPQTEEAITIPGSLPPGIQPTLVSAIPVGDRTMLDLNPSILTAPVMSFQGGQSAVPTVAATVPPSSGAADVIPSNAPSLDPGSPVVAYLQANQGMVFHGNGAPLLTAQTVDSGQVLATGTWATNNSDVVGGTLGVGAITGAATQLNLTTASTNPTKAGVGNLQFGGANAYTGGTGTLRGMLTIAGVGSFDLSTEAGVAGATNALAARGLSVTTSATGALQVTLIPP